MYISKTDLEKLKIDASSGNSQAASKLANYFAFYEFNNEKFIFWLIRSAELGNTRAQYDLAYIFFDHYQDSNDKNKLDEAEKWALLAQKMGCLLLTYSLIYIMKSRIPKINMKTNS